MIHRLSLILIVALIAAACGTPPEGGDDGWDWCYTHDFGDQIYGDFIDGNPDAYAQWVAGRGYVSIDGQMTIPPVGPATMFDVYPERVDVYVFRPDGVLGDIPVHAAVNIYGWNLVVDSTLPAGFDYNFEPIWFGRTYNPSDETGTSISGNIITYVEGDGQTPPYKDIGIDLLKVYGNGASPFIDNECADETPTPIASNTSAPSATPVVACWGAEWDFREERKEFSGTTWQINSGFVSALSTSPSLSQRALSLERELDPTSPDVRVIRVGYYAELGFNSGDISLSLDGVEVASEPIESGLNYLVFDIAPLLVSFDEIAVTAVVGESPSAADPGGYLRVTNIELFGIGAAPTFENLLVPTFFLMNCPSSPTSTASPTPTLTPTPTGTLSMCWRMDYDFVASNHSVTISQGTWGSGQGLLSASAHPSGFLWNRALSFRDDGPSQPVTVSRVDFHQTHVLGENPSNFKIEFVNPPIGQPLYAIYDQPISEGVISWQGPPTATRWIGATFTAGEDIGVIGDPATDPGGSIVISKMIVWGTGALPGTEWTGTKTALPCHDFTPTPTLNPTSTGTPFPTTPTRTPTPTPTRTSIPTLQSPTPTRTPVVVQSPTPRPPTATPTQTRTRTPTRTPTTTSSPTNTPVPPAPSDTPSPGPSPTPTDTPVPFPTSPSSTPVATQTATGIPTYDFGEVGEVEYPVTIIPEAGNLSEFHSDIYNGLSTAAAELNALPADIDSFAPDIDGNFQIFSSYARSITSGVSLQEIMGRKLYPIGEHIFYALTVLIFMTTVKLSVRFLIFIVRFVIWVVQQILRIIPFVG